MELLLYLGFSIAFVSNNLSTGCCVHQPQSFFLNFFPGADSIWKNWIFPLFFSNAAAGLSLSLALN